MDVFSPITVQNSADDLPGRGSLERVYLMDFGDGYVKIGVSTNLVMRFVQNFRSRLSLGILGHLKSVAYTEECYNARDVEARLLKHFGRAHGEYVAASFDDALAKLRVEPIRTHQTAEEIKASALTAEFFEDFKKSIRPEQQVSLPPRLNEAQQFIDFLQIHTFYFLSCGMSEEDADFALSVVHEGLNEWISADPRLSVVEMLRAVSKSIERRGVAA